MPQTDPQQPSLAPRTGPLRTLLPAGEEIATIAAPSETQHNTAQAQSCLGCLRAMSALESGQYVVAVFSANSPATMLRDQAKLAHRH
ncbi:hypothetical protein FOWG_15533 [Fusarium oxysporum f. sp. lycopersici MN25]|nr:hypothetical protein FOWG_15533 [Fusarium oxysporum f. sp. lycopersici MN25]